MRTLLPELLRKHYRERTRICVIFSFINVTTLSIPASLLDGSPWPVFEGEGLCGVVEDAKIISLRRFEHFYAELSILSKGFSFCRSS